MQLWVNFWEMMYWTVLTSFVLVSTNLVKLLFFSEILWTILYTISLYMGILNDESLFLALSFFILGFAGLEFSVGILLVLLFKHIFKSQLLRNTYQKQNTKINEVNTYVDSAKTTT